MRPYLSKTLPSSIRTSSWPSMTSAASTTAALPCMPIGCTSSGRAEAKGWHISAPERATTRRSLAELVGNEGRVVAVEYDAKRAQSAKDNLKDRSNVDVIAADGRRWPQQPT